MATKGMETRERILDAAHGLILEHGYAGLSIDQLIGSLGLTKGAFFHHFKSKQALARSLIRRFADESIGVFESHLARAKKLSDDPLQQLLILIGLYEEMFEGLREPFPGCLFASYIYELGQFDDDIKQVINEEFLLSRAEISALLEAIEKRYPAVLPVDREALADAFQSIFEGAFILSKSLNEPDLIAQQLRLYKTLLEALYARH